MELFCTEFIVLELFAPKAQKKSGLLETMEEDQDKVLNA